MYHGGPHYRRGSGDGTEGDRGEHGEEERGRGRVGGEVRVEKRVGEWGGGGGEVRWSFKIFSMQLTSSYKINVVSNMITIQIY